MNSDLQLPSQYSLDICGILHNTVELEASLSGFLAF